MGAVVCAFNKKYHKHWAQWVRISIILSQLVQFVIQPLVTIPSLLGLLAQYTTSANNYTSTNLTFVYPAFDSTFVNGYVDPTPNFLCGGSEWSTIQNARVVSFCQALNF